MRFQQGLRLDTGNKILYLDPGSGHSVYLGHRHGLMYFHPEAMTVNFDSAIGTGWDAIMGGPLADGKWHLYEFHAKAGITNGIGELWVDGVKIISATNVNWNTTTGWSDIRLPENGSYFTGGVDYFQDIDEVAISTTGYIGPINSGALAAPRNLRVQ